MSAKLSIHNALTIKLGRLPKNDELRAEVDRIKREALQEVAAAGKLKHQRKR